MGHNKNYNNNNQRGTNKIHAAISKKYQNYPPTTILKHANVLAKVNK